ncbi:MAG: TetR/AcrR family transcriptional regulator [Rhodobacteraceae bacterium]|nr:TetR/AcrR family transcriptional regulator [Paracoccaceae bacterium]
MRNSKVTKEKILDAAKREFADKGLGGARVDEIARIAGVNKSMLYQHFESKEGLFKAVVEYAYLDIRKSELALQLGTLDAKAAMDKLIRFTWQYYLDNPEFIRLVNSENLHKAKHIKQSSKVLAAHRNYVSLVKSILDRGVAEGIFRENIDPVNLNITIAAVGYYYLTNSHTGSVLFERNLMDSKALEERLLFNIDTIMKLICLPPAEV